MFYSKQELLDIGFIEVGNNTRISKNQFFMHNVIKTVRIDDFSTLKGNIIIETMFISSFVLLVEQVVKLRLKISTVCNSLCFFYCN